VAGGTFLLALHGTGGARKTEVTVGKCSWEEAWLEAWGSSWGCGEGAIPIEIAPTGGAFHPPRQDDPAKRRRRDDEILLMIGAL